MFVGLGPVVADGNITGGQGVATGVGPHPQNKPENECDDDCKARTD